MSRQPPTRTCTAVRTLIPADPRGQWASSVEELVPDPGAALDHAGPLVDQPAVSASSGSDSRTPGWQGAWRPPSNRNLLVALLPTLRRQVPLRVRGNVTCLCL